jgi:hypothetical protein
MASEIAGKVAEEVIKTVRNGKIPNLQEIQQKHGYSKQSAKSMMAKRTKTYKKAMAPFEALLKKEIDKIQQEMANRDISEEKYKDLGEVLDKLYKNYQLATGGATENVKFSLASLFNAKSN